VAWLLSAAQIDRMAIQHHVIGSYARPSSAAGSAASEIAARREVLVIMKQSP